MITADIDFYLDEDGLVAFDKDVTAILVFPTLDGRTNDTTVDVQVRNYTGASVGYQVTGIQLTFTKDELTAYTASGADDVLEYKNLVEQAVDAYLEGLAVNSAVTFTIV